ncbi:flagellar basal body rod protein FlgC [Frateuria aurantia]
MSMLSIFQISGSGMAAESLRLNTTASNLANADTVSNSPDTAYRAKEPVFATIKNALAATTGEASADSDEISTDADDATAGVESLGITESNQPISSRYEPDNPEADASGFVYGSNVNPIDELVNMISASRSYQSNVEVMNNAKSLMLKTLTLGQ